MYEEPELVMYKPFDRLAPDGAKRPWPRMPARAKDVPRPRPNAPAVTHKSPYKGDRRTPLEVLSRLAGGTTYRTPDGVGSTRSRGIGIDDLAHALGFVRDPLAQRLALAFACGSDAEWPAIHDLAAPPLLRTLQGSHNTRRLVAGSAKYRARLVLHDAFHDIALCRPPRHARDGGARLKMTPRDYRTLYKATAGFLETVAEAGAYWACQALFGSD